MKIKSMLVLAAASLGIASQLATAQDAQFDQFDLLMFFRNPSGSTGTTRIVTYSLGSATDLFRDAATPTSGNYGGVIPLGNVNSALSGNYGTDWTALASNSSLFAGAAANSNSLTTSLDSGVENQDYARTVYFTRKRSGQGTAGSANSTNFSLPGATTQANIVSNIEGANNVALSQSNPYSVSNSSTVLDTLNPISGSTPATAFTAINGGVLGRMLTTSAYTLGSVNNVVLGLDLYRATPLAQQTGSWEQINGISGVSSLQGYYLGTITLSSNGDVNFVAVPEPATVGPLAAGFGLAFLARRRRKQNS